MKLTFVCNCWLTKGTKLPNGNYVSPEKVRYANTRLALEFMANCVATGQAMDSAVALVILDNACFPTSLFFCLPFILNNIESAESNDCRLGSNDVSSLSLAEAGALLWMLGSLRCRACWP